MKAPLPRRSLFKPSMVVNTEPVVNLVVNSQPQVVVNNRSKDRHNKERRREYMRQYMAAKRAKK